MGELGDALDQLAAIEKIEAEIKELKSKLGKKELTSEVISLQTAIIKVQREAIDTLSKAIGDKDKISKKWNEIIDAIKVSRDELKDIERSLGDVKSRKVTELEDLLVAKDKVIDSLSEDIVLYKDRIKVLTGGQ